MISVEEARQRILDVLSRLPSVSLPLGEARGLVLAQNIRSPVTVPPLANTSMDGYAVRAIDTTGATQDSPVRLSVIGEVAAGYLFDGAVGRGEAVRIMTGAPIPAGADAIVPFEETDEPAGRNVGSFAKGRDHVGVLKAAAGGNNVRLAGEDIRAGDLVLEAGTELGPAQIGVIASLGMNQVEVVRRARVAVISTGDELLAPGETQRPGTIYDANGPGICAMIEEAGGEPLWLGISRDTVDDLTAHIEQAADADLIITSAGVSRGDYDVVKDVLEREGDIGFWTVRMRPGKPLAFGTLNIGGRPIPHIGLPGNPVSAMVTFELFGRAAIYKLMGRTGWERQQVKVRLTERLVNPDPRRFYARAVVEYTPDGLVARLSGGQGSNILSAMAAANALVVCPEDRQSLDAGEQADALLLGPPVLPH